MQLSFASVEVGLGWRRAPLRLSKWLLRLAADVSSEACPARASDSLPSRVDGLLLFPWRLWRKRRWKRH